MQYIYNHDTYNDVMYNGMLYLPKKKITYIDHFLYLHAVILCFFAYCIYTPCHKHSNHQNNLQAGKRHFFTMWHNNL